MAELNRFEPAAMTMLGVICLKQRDLNLAAAAFSRAVELDSAQAPLLESRIASIHDHIAQARRINIPLYALGAAVVGLGILFAWKLLTAVKASRVRRSKHLR
jgi:hypothetical protein